MPQLRRLCTVSELTGSAAFYCFMCFADSHRLAGLYHLSPAERKDLNTKFENLFVPVRLKMHLAFDRLTLCVPPLTLKSSENMVKLHIL